MRKSRSAPLTAKRWLPLVFNAQLFWPCLPCFFSSPASSTFSTSSTSSASPASWGACKYLFGKGLWCNYRIRITVYDGHQGMCWLITNVLPLMNHSLVNRSHQIFVIHFTPRRKILNPGKTRFIESLNITGSFSPLWNCTWCDLFEKKSQKYVFNCIMFHLFRLILPTDTAIGRVFAKGKGL